MPIYNYSCDSCGKKIETLLPMEHDIPVCCDSAMNRIYTIGNMRIKSGYPLYVDRMEEIHKKQEDKGERLRMIHPSEVL